MRSAWTLCKGMLVIMLCSILVTGCNSSKSTSITSSLTPAPLQLTSFPWESISLPPTGTPLLSYSVSPTDPDTMYACAGEGSISLWETHNAGKHWSSISIPATHGTGCSFSISSSQPQHIAFLVTDTFGQRPCDHDTLYLSADSGNTWRHIPHTSIAPEGAGYGFCTITVTNHHLYMWYTYGGKQTSVQASLLERTDNDGVTWSRADATFGMNALFSSPEVGKDETLAISVRDSSLASHTNPVLWMSHNAGRSWQQIGVQPPQAGIYLLTTSQQRLSWPTPATPFYTLAHEQIPSNLYRLQAFESVNGQQWSTLPPLPVPGTSQERPGLLQALATTDDGRLLAFGVNPQIGMPTTIGVGQKPIATFWLWLWNPHTAHWQVLSAPLTHLADEGCGLCWSGQLSRGSDHMLSLSVYHEDDMSSLFQVRLPDSE